MTTRRRSPAASKKKTATRKRSTKVSSKKSTTRKKKTSSSRAVVTRKGGGVESHRRHRDATLNGSLVRAPSTPISPKNREDFLANLAATGNVTRSAAATGKHRETYYTLRDKDPDFAAQWDHAVEAAADELEAEARRRAVEGVDEPVVYQGAVAMTVDEKTGERVPLTVKRYSDTLLIFLLNGARPEKYRQVHAHTGPDGKGSVKIDLRHAIFAKLFPDQVPPTEVNQ